MKKAKKNLKKIYKIILTIRITRLKKIIILIIITIIMKMKATIMIIITNIKKLLYQFIYKEYNI